MEKKYFILLFLYLFHLNAYAKPRITGPTDPAKRCVNKGINGKTCESVRKKAWKLGCITEEEYHILKKYGSYPSCNSLLGEGLNMLDGWCPCGCFAPQTLISVPSETGLIENKKRASDIVFGKNKEILVSHLTEGSTLGNFLYGASNVRIRTYGKESKKIYRIKPEGRSSLLLTEKHPILLGTGIMKQIKNVKKTDRLVLSSGESISIEKIERIPFKQDVLNFSVDVEENSEHLIFANDIVIGDQYWQASLEDLLNQILLREG